MNVADRLAVGSVKTLSRKALRALLAKEFERPLLRLVARRHQFLERLLAQRVLLLGHDAALVLHQVLLGQTAARVVRRAVPHLRLGAHHLAALAAHHRLARSTGRRGRHRQSGLDGRGRLAAALLARTATTLARAARATATTTATHHLCSGRLHSAGATAHGVRGAHGRGAAG